MADLSIYSGNRNKKSVVNVVHKLASLVCNEDIDSICAQVNVPVSLTVTCLSRKLSTMCWRHQKEE